MANDSAHCGSCTHACPAGQGCVAGSCVNSVTLSGTPKSCPGGGAEIVNPANLGGCLGALAATTFRWTLCSCKDVQLSDYILVDAFDSTKGPYMPGHEGGGVGADHCYHSSSNSVPPTGGIYGDLWASCTQGIDDSANELITHDLKTGGPLASSATMTIGNDAYANGSVTGGVDIGGKLYVPSGANVSVMPKGGVVRGPVSFPPPCDCAPNQLVPIAAIVASHASPNNDNASIGLDENILASPAAPTRLDLPCGNYYLTSIHPSIAVTIWAHGHTALYIGQDVQTSDAIAFGVDPTGSLDIFIAGRLDTSSTLVIGSPNHPALTRTYVGSPQGINFSADARIAGNIYAAYGPVNWSAGTAAYGSVFAGDFNASAPTVIHYDAAVLGAGNDCPSPGTPPPPADGGGSGSVATSGVSASEGGPPPACMSCRDCLNQACNSGMCGSCATSTDCCAPLICNNGTCVSSIIIR